MARKRIHTLRHEGGHLTPVPSSCHGIRCRATLRDPQHLLLRLVVFRPGSHLQRRLLLTPVATQGWGSRLLVRGMVRSVIPLDLSCFGQLQDSLCQPWQVSNIGSLDMHVRGGSPYRDDGPLFFDGDIRRLALGGGILLPRLAYTFVDLRGARLSLALRQ